MLRLAAALLADEAPSESEGDEEEKTESPKSKPVNKIEELAADLSQVKLEEAKEDLDKEEAEVDSPGKKVDKSKKKSRLTEKEKKELKKKERAEKDRQEAEASKLLKFDEVDYNPEIVIFVKR